MSSLARSMDLDASSSYSPPSLRHKLRTTVCGCFGSTSPGGGERAGNGSRWRRRAAATGDFRYDALSYALNFDEGDDDHDTGTAAFRCRDFSSRLPHSPPPPARQAAAVAID